ncbi:CDP-alcohol phosphatidyltransferase family protein [Enterococcus sp.]|uniref:CDP-alcohol phosphatidyltransferase family protein n=1 Tax=Enterococcus sp. TaxID=35783 RepID=UPI002898887E|nr:CDP-alcohol phosphatidyltransferase family protein [Enterococcus sp.]
MLGYYDYTVILTYCNLICGLLGSLSVVKGNHVIGFIFLVVAGCCDACDGIVAKTKKNRTLNERLYGIQIDSLSDMISFCILPVVIVLSIEGYSQFNISVGLMLVFAGMIRLAYFNVTETLNQIQDNTFKRTFYLGLPVTSISILLPVYRVLTLPWEVNNQLSYFLIFVSVAFVVPIKFPKLNIQLKRVKSYGENKHSI